MSNEHLSDEEAIAEAAPVRGDLLKTAALVKGRPLGPLTVRPLTAETLSYLFECENFFIRGMKGERVAPANANAIWSTAEFIYIHAADPDEVASNIWDRPAFKQAVRGFLAGPMNDPLILAGALPIIEQMVSEYFAAQTQAQDPKGAKGLRAPGKGSARHGKPATLR
jgi:hypothetical protein